MYLSKEYGSLMNLTIITKGNKNKNRSVRMIRMRHLEELNSARCTNS